VARPELPLGTWGRIRREELGPNRFRARARFHDYDGHTRDVEAWADTAAAAERALRVKLRDRSAPGDDDITRDMRMTRLSELWINEIVAEDRITPQTVNQYESSLRTSILPALGNLRIREATVGRLDRFLKTTAENRPAAAKSAKCVLGQMLSLAVRHGALPTNPVRETGRLRKPRRTITALTAENLEAVRAAIRQWQTPLPGKPGPRHTSDLADVVDLMLATGGRIGEILALRWKDLDLAAARPTLTFSGTIVFIKGRGFVRQPWTKSDAGYRTLTLPSFAVGMLLDRQITAADNPYDAIFASRRGTWLSPSNVRRQWRQARRDTDLTWITPHTFRKTVATLIDREADAKTAAAQLGHTSEEITNTYYIEKPAVAPDVSDILQQLGSQQTSR
jgi:integrase